MTEKIWQFQPEIPPKIAQNMSNYPLIVAQLLYNRGIKTKKEAEIFFNGDYRGNLNNPYLLKDLKKAVVRIKQAKEKQETIGIFGDYDADGVTATALLKEGFSKLGFKKIIPYLPDRVKEGYGMNLKALGYLKKQGVNLIISVDCGVSNNEEIDWLKKQGIDTIVIDHHHPPDKLPKAIAIINPKQKDCPYPFKELTGVGLAFKFIQALIFNQIKDKKKQEQIEKWLLDLVAIGTIADCAPLTNENRILVKYGLIVLQKTKRIGLQKLFKISGTNPSEINTNTVGFRIAPRINAAGRMDHANHSLNLILTHDKREADQIAQLLEAKNQSRQNLTNQIFAEIKENLLKTDLKQKLIFTSKKDWPEGIVGLVAGKISEEFHRPTIIIQEKETEATGSGRSIESFNIIKAITQCEKYLSHFGGHKQAAGFSLPRKNLAQFKKAIEKIANEKITAQDLQPTIKIDGKITFPELTIEFAKLLEQFNPFGEANPKPNLLSENLICLLYTSPSPRDS